MLKVGIIGISGRMGLELARIGVDRHIKNQLTVSAATVQSGDASVGRDIGAVVGRDLIGVVCSDNVVHAVKSSDVVIDFTIPEHSLYIAKLASIERTAYVCGTTGFTSGQMLTLQEYAQSTQLFWSPNMSITVNLLAFLVKKAAGLLNSSFDIEVLEMHHRNKVDAPSGTALMLGKAAAEGRCLNFDDVKIFDRSGKRPKDGIGFAVLRGGGVVGEHSVIFASNEERLELKDVVYSRAVFAEGAFAVLDWLVKQTPSKLYSISDYIESIAK
ncbi:4-hydroxy-tetrahydrodipicolinate reductase [Rickettsiales endosymbiont of Peranema trichophorum]|uniref:4-hydroxy-tetrahydrodipicolinate reductase n=1 Tax=Rickettsiales endosymbiont of Peranema trichophorum TaxID=2486577 RepID=UPI00102379CC|nr:4-hydroxy-tetrahydrodipicolinate reductase [Rickettsiales endosymbiont of Peranema trichophorum]RZI46349.1 4-hydroxy-tetrahydrodipicolinate reductase [Rickettsiales endosymbiont of Peranema trichophorum]